MMSRIIASQYMSLDGVIEDPVGMENSGLGDWIGPFSRGPAGDRFKDGEVLSAAAVLLGRRTYDGFAAVWPTMKSDVADRMNALPKYLASRTVTKPEWNNTSLLGEDLVASVRDLRAKLDGNIIIYGSASICHALASAGRIDEYAIAPKSTISWRRRSRRGGDRQAGPGNVLWWLCRLFHGSRRAPLGGRLEPGVPAGRIGRTRSPSRIFSCAVVESAPFRSTCSWEVATSALPGR